MKQMQSYLSYICINSRNINIITENLYKNNYESNMLVYFISYPTHNVHRVSQKKIVQESLKNNDNIYKLLGNETLYQRIFLDNLYIKYAEGEV